MRVYSFLVTLAFGSCGLAERIPDSDYHEIAARQRGGGGGWGGGGESGGGSSGTCQWSGHCAGAACETENDCDGQLGCVNARCATVGGASPTPVRTTARTTLRTTARPTATAAACQWTGHCLGATCDTENDCDGQLGCVSGKCANVGSGPVVTTPRPVQPTSTRPGVITVTVTRSVGGPATPSPTRPIGGGGGGSPQPCGDSPLACIGASCQSDADCGFSLIICDNGVCGL